MDSMVLKERCLWKLELYEQYSTWFGVQEL